MSDTPTPHCVRVSERYNLLIFDADGTLRRCKVPGQPCPNKPDEWELIPGVESLREIQWGSRVRNGAVVRKYLAIASNQSGVALGYMSQIDAYGMLLSLANTLNGHVPSGREVRMCPHAADAGCDCRKPKPGLLYELLDAYPLIDRCRVLFVGDQETDRQAAQAVPIDFMWAWDFFGRTREEWTVLSSGTAPLGIVDTRNDRWKEAEARCTASHADPKDLAIIAEEQAKWDGANPEASIAAPPPPKCESCGHRFARGACERVFRNIPGATRSMVICSDCSSRYPLGTIPPNAPIGLANTGLTLLPDADGPKEGMLWCWLPGMETITDGMGYSLDSAECPEIAVMKYALLFAKRFGEEQFTVRAEWPGGHKDFVVAVGATDMPTLYGLRARIVA